MASLRKFEASSSSAAALEEPSTELTLRIASSFQPMIRTADDDGGDRRGKKKMISTNPPAQYLEVVDLTLDDDDLPVVKNSFEVGEGSGTRRGEDQALALVAPSPIVRSQQEIMDRRRINRFSAQRSRQRKNKYVSELEKQAKYLENKIAVLRPQVVAHEHQRRLLLIEHHEMKHRMILMEKNMVLKEMETERMRDELMRIREFRRLQEQIRAQEMRSWGADITLMSPNPNPEAKTGEAPSEMEVDTDKSRINKGKGKEKA